MVSMRKLLGSLLIASSIALGGEKPADKVFVGYLYGRGDAIDYGLYTHLCHAFVVADANGVIQSGGSAPDTRVTKEAHKHGVKVLISLGGWGWDKQFAAIVSKPESEDRYVNAVMKLVDEYDYDGIDLDWEYPDTAEEVVGFDRLASRLRKALDLLAKTKHRQMVLTMAAAADPPTLKWLKKAVIMEDFDWINVMTYDFTGDWTDYAGHHSPLFASRKQPGSTPHSVALSIEYLLGERGIPADRLTLGIPLYGRGFGVSEPYASTKGIAKPKLPPGDYRNLHQLQVEKGWTRIWDDETKNPWLLDADHKRVIGYDDEESVVLKTHWAMDKGLRGVFFWEINADRLPDHSHPLQAAARKEWEKEQR